MRWLDPGPVFAILVASTACSEPTQPDATGAHVVNPMSTASSNLMPTVSNTATSAVASASDTSVVASETSSVASHSTTSDTSSSTASTGSSTQGAGGTPGAGTTGAPAMVGSNPEGTGAMAAGANTGGSATTIDGEGAAGAQDAGSIAQGPDEACATFSFFVTSQRRLFELAEAFNGSTEGFGGDLTYGETGPGAGLRGADKICTQIAEAACAGNGKTWRAFLSVGDDGSGNSVNAIDRVGSGPWYDRNARLLALSPAELQADRPNADAAIADDLPNEDGFGNHRPDGTEASLIDNHNVMTGSDELGHYAEPDEHSTTCNDWTDATLGPDDAAVGPNIGDSWWRVNEERSGILGWIDAGHNAAGCAAGAINPDEDFGFGVGEGDINCGTVGCMGGYGGIYCFALGE